MPAALDPTMAAHYLLALFEFHSNEAEVLNACAQRAYREGATLRMTRLRGRASTHALTASAAWQGLQALHELHPELVH